MTIPLSLNDREHKKFRDLNDNVAVAVVSQESLPTDPTKNASYTITKTYSAPTLTTVIQKVLEGTTYTKTIVKNTSTNVETISAWS